MAIYKLSDGTQVEGNLLNVGDWFRTNDGREIQLGDAQLVSDTPRPLWQELGMNSVQHDRLSAMGLSDAEIGKRLQAYMQSTGATQADPMNWGDMAMNRAMGLPSDPNLEAAQQKAIALTQQKNQSLNGQTDYGFLPMAAGLALGGTVAPWLAGTLGGGALGSLGANAAVSGLTSGLFGGDPLSAMGRSVLMGGLNQATGGIGNAIKSGAESVPDWMKGFYSGAQNINGGTQVAGGTGGAGLGGGMDPWQIDTNSLSGSYYTDPWAIDTNYLSQGNQDMGVSSFPSIGGAVGGAGILSALKQWLGGAADAVGMKGSSLLGLGLGGLLGGMSANPNPSGTVTSVSDIPDWQKQYAQYTQQLASGLLGKQSQDPRLTQAGTDQMLKTVNGDYLNANPYLDATYKKAADQVGAGIDSRFSAAGRYGSGAHQGVLGTSLGNLATDIYGGNYQAERGRQSSAMLGVPSYQTASTSALFAPLNQYKGLTTGYGGGSQTNPYFSNTAGGILSGALAGSQLGRMW